VFLVIQEQLSYFFRSQTPLCYNNVCSLCFSIKSCYTGVNLSFSHYRDVKGMPCPFIPNIMILGSWNLLHATQRVRHVTGLTLHFFTWLDAYKTSWRWYCACSVTHCYLTITLGCTPVQVDGVSVYGGNVTDDDKLIVMDAS
jgi:hypothetical protein